MFCSNCGKEIDEDTKFCPHCGTNLQDPAPKAPAPAPAPAPVEEKKPAKVWTVFSRISKILGIVCIATALIPYLNYFSLSFSIVGIVMACLGRKAKTEETDAACRIGLALSIAALVVSFVTAILYTVLFELFLEGMMMSTYY